MRVVVLTKRQYTNRDVIDDRFGRLWEIPFGLAREGHRVTCICLSYRRKSAGPKNYEDAQGNTIRWISINLGVFAIFGILKYLYVANKIMREERPDVIWSCSDTIYNVVGYYFARLYGCRSVADLYDNFESFVSYRVPVLRTLFRKAIRESNGVSCVGECLRRYIVTDYGREKLTSVITNAVDTGVFRPMDKVDCRNKLGLPQDVVLVGSAGAMHSHRGADMMFQANAGHSGELEGVHFAIAGSRPSGTPIPEADNIHDLGLLPFEDVPTLLNSLDLAVVYNRTSQFGDFCFPQKFYEILACGIPIIAADVGEMSLLLESYPHLLYEDGNVESFLLAAEQQLTQREIPDLDIPTWRDQALKLQALMESVSLKP
ncbi:MAG: glycosyltransferase [Woeseiaceae bacterium]